MALVHTRATFVDSKVPTNDLTEQIISDILPFFPRECKVIGGYLDQSGQYWKVNWHWEYLQYMLGKFSKIGVDPKFVTRAKDIASVLAKSPPDPPSGYLKSQKPGTPRDRSTLEKIIERWSTVKQAKCAFTELIAESDLIAKDRKKEKAWYLAIAPIAKPGSSKHGTGYALDISGPNTKVSAICRALGASVVLDEKSHVHVEFARGVNQKAGPTSKPEKAPPADPVSPTLPAAVLGPMINDFRNACRIEDYKQDVPHPGVLNQFGEDVLAELSKHFPF